MKLLMNHPGRASALALALAGCVVQLGCVPENNDPAVQPSNQVTQGTVTQTPTGAGIAWATALTFTAQGFVDPKGSSLIYLWNLGEDTGIPTGLQTAATITHTYKKAGTYDIWVTAQSSLGATTPGSLKGLRIVALTGLWGLRDATGQVLMDNTSITQSEASLSGEDTRANCRYTVAGRVSDLRRVNVTYTRLPNDCQGSSLPVSFTFSGEADEQIKAFTGTMTPGGSAKMVKCSEPGVCE